MFSDLKIARLFEFSNLLIAEIGQPGRLLVTEPRSIETSRVVNKADQILSSFYMP